MSDLEQEVRAALRAKAPSAEERRAWARTALAMKGGAGGRRWGRIVGLAGAAAAALAAAVLLSRPDRPSPPPAPRHAGSVEDERAANDAYLEEMKGALKTVPPGHFAVIVGGDTFRVGPDIDELLAWSDKGWPDARHRFVIRVDPAIPLGDTVCDTAPVPETGAGLTFLDAAGVSVKRGDGVWTVSRDGRTLEIEGERPVLEATVDGRPVRLELDNESLAPLVVPAETLSARFELPGATILEDLDRAWRTYRRHLVKVKHEGLGIDGWYEAVGAPGEWVAVRLGGHVIRGLEPGQEPDGAYFVLQYRDEDVERLNALFDGLEDLGPYARFAVHGKGPSSISLVRRGGDGSVLGEILDLTGTNREELRKFLDRK